MVSSIAAFFSAFIIAYIKSWKFALILSCILPTILGIFGLGGTYIAKYAQQGVKEYASASTIAEEIISSVKTAQAFGAQHTLGRLYDQSLVRAQKVGYKQQFAGAVMLSVMFFSIYGFYALGFCTPSPLAFTYPPLFLFFPVFKIPRQYFHDPVQGCPFR